MRCLFSRVMEGLAFQATPGFVENLFQTSVLMRVYSPDGSLAAFGNIRIREAGGLKVHHVFAVYVDPDHRERKLSVHAVETVLRAEALANGFCLKRPLVVTGSAVNPMVVRSLAKRTQLWPDLTGKKRPPPSVLAVARDSARYYPAKGERDFQVAITPEYAVLDMSGRVQRSSDSEFDRRFYEYARPEELRLLLFVARIRFRDLVGSSVRAGASLSKIKLHAVIHRLSSAWVDRAKTLSDVEENL